MKTISPMKRWLSITILGVAAALASTANAVPLLVGSATFDSANDLTVIQDGGQVMQFLDLTSTQGMTIANAVGTYSASGFHWATGVEVARLYGAFGITYQSVVKDVVFLSVPAVQATAYTSYLGITIGNAAIGWIDDNTDGAFHTYSCISVDSCGFGAFVANNDLIGASEPRIGVFLVRNVPNQVPEPGSLLLVALALLEFLRSTGAFARSEDGSRVGR